MQGRLIALLIILAVTIIACDNASPTPTATTEATTAPTATTEPTSAPTATPITTQNLPALELLSAAPETCTLAESYSAVLGFNAMYYEMTTDNRLHIRLLADDGSLIMEDDTSSENKDGEEGWGFYPLAYDLPENAHLRVEVTVFESDDEDAIQSSFSSLTYDWQYPKIMECAVVSSCQANRRFIS